jgi:hypothetical protein
MTKFKYSPFFCTSVAVHIALGAFLFFSSAQKPKPKLHPFKERIVHLPPEPKMTCPTQTPSAPSSHQTSTPLPPPKKVNNIPPPTSNKPLKTPLTHFQSRSPHPPTKPTPSREKQQATLKKLAQLAHQLAEEAASQETHIAQLSWPTQVQVSTDTESCQQEAFCALFQQYVCLPFPGEVRIKLEFSKEGRLLICSILSAISPTDKQHIIKQIQQIPFQTFFNTYKPSKNIVFHIRLQGNSA